VPGRATGRKRGSRAAQEVRVARREKGRGGNEPADRTGQTGYDLSKDILPTSPEVPLKGKNKENKIVARRGQLYAKYAASKRLAQAPPSSNTV